MTTQRYELEAWLGDDHGLTSNQIDDLLDIANEIDERYPDDGYAEEREVALTTAYRLMAAEDGVVETLGEELRQARWAEQRAIAGLRQAAIMGVDSQAGLARRAGVDRMTVRSWMGLR